MDILISVTIILAVTAMFLGITRLLHPRTPDPNPDATTAPAPAPSAGHLFLPTLLYLLCLALLAILTPLAIVFSSRKLPTLIALLAFLTLPAIAYAYLARFGYLTPAPPPTRNRNPNRPL